MGITNKLNFHKKRSKKLINSMLLAGIFPYELAKFDIRKYAWTCFSIFSFSYIIVFTAYNLTVLHGFLIIISIVKTILSAAMCSTVMMITYIKRHDLKYIVEMTERNFYTYSDEAIFTYKFSTFGMAEKITIYGWAFFFIGIYGSALLSHPIYLAFNKNLLKNGSKMLIFTWVPFKSDTISSFYMAHTMLFIITIPIVFTIIGNVSLTLNIQMEFRNQFERLIYALRSTTSRAQRFSKKELHVLPKTIVTELENSQDYDAVFTEEENRKFEMELVECVKHYQKIVIAYQKFHNWFGLTYSVILAHSVLTLAMMSYGALLNVKNFGVCAKYLSVLFLYTGHAYVQCSSGEKIFQMNEDLSNEIYNLPWHRQPASRRKLIYIMLCETQKPIRLFGFLIYPASLTIFSSIMKLSYSYLNLLRTYGSSFRGR